MAECVVGKSDRGMCRFSSLECLPSGACLLRDELGEKRPLRRATIGQFPWRRRGTESLGSSPGLPRKLVTQSSETSHTAPVTPLHEGSRRRSPLGVVGRRAKASSTPQLLEAATPASENRKWSENTEQTNETRVNTQTKEPTTRRNLPATTSTESVLQKFRKTFSLRFHPKKQSSSNRDSCDLGEALSEMLGEPSEDEPSEPKSRFGPLIWRSSKERKKLNKAARNAKCNSGDSGIQIEMMPGCGGADSSESHDTDPPGDDLDSPPSVRRRTVAKTASRPHSDLLNQILIDKFKAHYYENLSEIDRISLIFPSCIAASVQMQVVFVISNKDSHSFRRRTTGKSISGCRGVNTDRAFKGGRCFPHPSLVRTSALCCLPVLKWRGRCDNNKPTKTFFIVLSLVCELFCDFDGKNEQEMTSTVKYQLFNSLSFGIHFTLIRSINVALFGVDNLEFCREADSWLYSNYSAAELLNRDRSDLKQRPHRHNQVRRTRSDLGGQRLLQWDSRSSYKRLMSNPSPLRGRPQSPRKKPPDAPGGVQLRLNHRRGQLRRSLSQPLDIDKLSPLMRTKTAGLKTTGSATTSDDEAMSDSESSIASLTDRKKSLEMVILAEAVFDHVAFEAEELAFRAGDLIEVLETANREWWWGTCSGKSGWFPSQFVRLRVSQEDTVEDCLAAMASGHGIATQLRRRTSISLLSNDQVRTSVVKELLRTERDFVKVLEDVAEGYIAECRKRTDMFTEEQIKTIFINLEDILHFQANFVKDLEAQIDFEAPYKSCVGGCFLKHRAGFKMYSEYCNSHPTATAALQELYQYNHYSKFFEACRLMRGLIEIPLDGYLLTPVQRICKYPLQLAELLKYTRPDHKDYDEIKEALDAMRGVAVLINERKRRMESLEKLAAWQQRVEGWEGEDLIDSSTQLIHQGDVVKVTTGMWTNNITLFLFDHQVVYCKKDILKRNTYVYKGRICTETSEIIDVTDGKDNHLGVSVRHAIKIHSCIRDKWLLFCCRSSSDKQRWLQAFAEERKLVAQDKDDGLEFPSSAKQLAKVAARCQRRPPRKPRAGKSYKHPPTYMGSTLQLNSNSLGRKVGTWFTFGGHKKSRHRDVS
ncbi:Spermatogenesis-associated protein 13-like Protein [Tribolium castaneum]|uniref:Spermatogenesis-associated protein 13-like Protein n=1 Tax=Tribolium castaneum TaxID=7070 RepID=A0A139W8X7_TRICA|nr:Spermatogenesis-associated protein 13-like Protein [Tribolium castaneum]